MDIRSNYKWSEYFEKMDGAHSTACSTEYANKIIGFQVQKDGSWKTMNFAKMFKYQNICFRVHPDAPYKIDSKREIQISYKAVSLLLGMMTGLLGKIAQLLCKREHD